MAVATAADAAAAPGLKQFFLNDGHRRALCEEYLKRPFAGLSSLVEDAVGEHSRIKVEQIFTINVPITYYTRNPTTYRSLINPHNPQGLYHAQKLIFMLSALVSDGSFGSPLGSMPLNPDGRGAPVQQQAANPAGARGGGGGGGGFQGRRPGAPAQQGGGNALPLDPRGIVLDEGQSLTMQVDDGVYRDKVVPVVEELLSEGGKLMGHRYWFFVLDPALNLSRALQDCIRRNQAIYTNPANMPDEYITHSDIRSANQFVDNVLVPYVQNGLHDGMPREQRGEFQALLADWRSPQTATVIANTPLDQAQHPANPIKVLGKLGGFSLYLEGVCEEQCDPSNYFTLETRADDLTPAQNAALAAAALVGEEYEEDEEQGGEEGDGDPMVMGEDEDIPPELLEEVREIQRISGYQRGGEEAAAGGDANNNNRGVSSLRQHLLDNLKKTPDARVKMTCFPKPELACHVPTKNFGRRLLNLPLPHMLKYTGRAADDHKVMEASRKRFSALPMPEGGPQVVERLLQVEMNKLPQAERFDIDQNYLTSEEGYRTALMMIAQRLASVEEERSLEAARRDVRDMMMGRGAVSFSDEQDSDFDAGMAFAGFLPELVTQRITYRDLLMFAQKNAFLALRIENSYAWQEVMLRYPPGSPEHVEKAREYRMLGAKKLWNITMNSQLLPESVKKMRETYKGYRLEFRHGEHLDLIKNLSSYGNLKINLLSRYTGHFRGATNQNVYMLAKLVTLGTFVYDWEVRPNLLQLGPGSVGKSYVYEVLEIMAMGGFAVVGHSTDRAYSTGTDFSDETTCMHEAPLTFIGVDKYGRPVLPDEALKDRLTRNRTSTRSFAQDEQKNRLTKTEQAMIMGNILMASNDMIPHEESPLMQRFICIVVNELKRPDFRRGDQSFPLSDLVSSEAGKVLVHQEHLLYWYVFLATKLVMARVLPDVSMDAAELFVREILERFGERVGVTTDQPRKRKMIMSILTINAILYAVHMAAFSILAQPATKEEDPATGKLRHKDFDICYFVEEIVKRLYVTTEQVVDIMSMLGFMWDTEHRMNILGTIAHKICHGPERPEAFIPKHSMVRFMPVPNPEYTTGFIGGPGFHPHRRFPHPHPGPMPQPPAASRSSDVGAKFSKLLHNDRQQAASQQGGEEEDEPKDVPPFIPDARYIIFPGHELTAMHARVASSMEGNKPSDVEIMRQLRDASRATYEAHPAIVEDWTEEHEKRHQQELATKRRLGLERAENPDAFLREWKKAHPEYKEQRAPHREEGEEEEEAPLKTQHMIHWKLQLDRPTTAERIVIIEKNPVNPSEFMICVLLEYVIMNRRKDAMLSAITDVLSSSCMGTNEEGGRTFITSLPYVHGPSGETMPQFLRTVTIPWAPRSIVCRFPNIGTLDSDAFCGSTIRYSRETSAHDPVGIIRAIRGSSGIQFADQDPDIYFCWRHWSRSGLDISSQEYLIYTPALETERCRHLMQKITSGDNPYEIKMINEYPRDSVADTLRKRYVAKATKDITDSRILDELYTRQTAIMSSSTEKLMPNLSAKHLPSTLNLDSFKDKGSLAAVARAVNRMETGRLFIRKKEENPHFIPSVNSVKRQGIDTFLALTGHTDDTILESDKIPEKQTTPTFSRPAPPAPQKQQKKPTTKAAAEILLPQNRLLSKIKIRVNQKKKVVPDASVEEEAEEGGGKKRAREEEEEEEEEEQPKPKRPHSLMASELSINFDRR